MTAIDPYDASVEGSAIERMASTNNGDLLWKVLMIGSVWQIPSRPLPTTVLRDWKMAKTWLFQELAGPSWKRFNMSWRHDPIG